MAKPFKTYEELLLFLQDEKNLTIEDMDTARRILLKTSYYFNQIGRKDMHSFLSIMTKHRNVCAHGDRFFNYRTKDSITDTSIHEKLHIPQISGRYQMGKNDLFSEVIILKYLLDKEDFRNFYYELKTCLKKQAPGEDILALMGFPDNWMAILRMKC